MDILVQVLILIVGFVLLIKGADFLIDGASSVAQNFKVSKMLIGLTVVAFGTGMPEFSVSISAMTTGSTDMLLGNVIGSNILNILLLVGIAALIHPIKAQTDTVRKELPLLALISVALLLVFLDSFLTGAEANVITRSDGLILAAFFCIFLFYLFAMARRNRADKSKKAEKPKYKLGKALIITVVGLVGLVLGSNFVVNSASSIATAIGISERVIALTVVAFGTSLPELVTTVTAARKGEQDLLLGNIIGSNIFNICIVLGLPVAIFGAITPASFEILDLVMLILSVILLYAFVKSGNKINRWEGMAMLMVFAVYYTVVISGALA